MDAKTVDKLARRVQDAHTPPRRRRRAAQRLATAGSPKAAEALAVAAVKSADAGIVAIMHRAFDALADQDSIDAVCTVWRGTVDGVWGYLSGDAGLGELVRRSGWLASQPPDLRVLTALHTGQPEPLVAGDGQIARALVAVADGKPSPLRERAREALAGLARQDARDAVCELAIDGGSPAALDAAMAGSFAPADRARQAVLLFLAGDFERYAEFDFDGTLLRSVHAVAHERVRARLARHARESGRVDWVRVVTGERQPARLVALIDGPSYSGRTYPRFALSPDGGLMALSGFRGTAGGPGDVMVWRVRSGERVAHLTGFAEEITSLAITQDEVLVAGSAGKYQGSTLRLWRLPSSEPVISISSSALGAGPLAVTPDGSLLAAATYFCGIRLWRLPSRELAGTIDTEPGTTSVATTPDSSLLLAGQASCNFAETRLWRLPDGTDAGTLGPRSHACGLGVTPDGLLVMANPGHITLRRSALHELVGAAPGAVAPAQIERCRQTHGDQPAGRAWLDLISALVARQHRYDIEVGDGATPGAGAGAADIEIGSG